MAEDRIAVVGSKEFVDFPDLRLQHVPAKVDTGADSSAIWASDIKQADGELSFVLFDRHSPFYTGKAIKTRQYTVTSVKNSFGQAELRYKVNLQVVLAGRTINARFTLANRANNRLPILIGRRTLKNKFLVDVAKESTGKKVRFLLLSSAISEGLRRMAAEIAKSEMVDVTLARYNQLKFEINSTSHITLGDGSDLEEYDMVYFRSTATRHTEIIATVAGYLKKRGVHFFDPAASKYQATSKLYQYVVMADHGIRVPSSVYPANDFKALSVELGLPFIIKDIHGLKGRYNYLVRKQAEFDKALRLAEEGGAKLIAQRFIDNDGDYRLLVLGGKISTAIRRSRQSPDTHLNNVSTGAKAQLVEVKSLPADVQADALMAAKLMERKVAGVDMVADKTSEAWYCLEVNDGPQITSGSFVEDKIAAFVQFVESEAKSLN